MKVQALEIEELQRFCAGLVGLPVTRLWRGYGSALFLEFGSLKPWRYRRDGTWSQQGEWTVSVTWDWRIEGKRLILCGSSSDETRWPRAFRYLESTSLQCISITGRLPELDFQFQNGVHLVSFMTSEGNPDWAITRNGDAIHRTLSVRSGKLLVEQQPARPVVAQS